VVADCAGVAALLVVAIAVVSLCVLEVLVFVAGEQARHAIASAV